MNIFNSIEQCMVRVPNTQFNIYVEEFVIVMVKKLYIHPTHTSSNKRVRNF